MITETFPDPASEADVATTHIVNSAHYRQHPFNEARRLLFLEQKAYAAEMRKRNAPKPNPAQARALPAAPFKSVVDEELVKQRRDALMGYPIAEVTENELKDRQRKDALLSRILPGAGTDIANAQQAAEAAAEREREIYEAKAAVVEGLQAGVVAIAQLNRTIAKLEPIQLSEEQDARLCGEIFDLMMAADDQGSINAQTALDAAVKNLTLRRLVSTGVVEKLAELKDKRDDAQAEFRQLVEAHNVDLSALIHAMNSDPAIAEHARGFSI